MQHHLEYQDQLDRACQYLNDNPNHPGVLSDIRDLEAKLRNATLPAGYWAIHSQPAALEAQLTQLNIAWRVLMNHPREQYAQRQVEQLSDHLMRSIIMPSRARSGEEKLWRLPATFDEPPADNDANERNRL
jgi:hypothetical protein